MKKALLVIIGLVVLFLGYGAWVGSTPEGKQRREDKEAIKICRAGLEKMSIGTARMMSEACDDMAADFERKYGFEP